MTDDRSINPRNQRTVQRGWMKRLITETRPDVESPTDYARILLIGEYGSGKTRFSNVDGAFYLDYDDGLTTVTSPDGKPPKHVPFRIGDTKAYEDTMSIIDDLRTRGGPFAKGQDLQNTRVLVIDGVTMMAKVFLHEISVDAAASGQDITEFKPQFDEWGILVKRIESVINAAKQIPYHLIVTSRVKVEKDELTGALVGAIDIVGSYRNTIGYEFNEVYLVEKRRSRPEEKAETGSEIANDFFTAFHPRFKVKSRLAASRAIPGKIANPTWDTLIKPFYTKRGGHEDLA